jgi:flavin-dependent dehydrogenase
VTTQDVIVVGMGPAGSVTAAGLAGRGYSVLGLDRAVFPRDKACAEYCSPGVEDALRRVGAWAAVAPSTRSVPGMDLFVHDRPVLDIRYRHGSFRRHAFTIPRRTLDALLVTHARNRGATISEGLRVKGVSREGAIVHVSAVDRSGHSHDWTARVVVGADGLHSTVAKAVGFPATAHRPRRLGLITHYATDRPLPDIGQMHLGSGAYCGLAPLPDDDGAHGVVNVGLVLSMKMARKYRGGSRSLLEAGIGLLPGVAAYLAGGRQIRPLRGMGPLAYRPPVTSGHGFVLVGDAAGFMDPFTGEGIYRAIRGAELATDAIDEALRRSWKGLPDLVEHDQVRKRDMRAKENLTWLIQLALESPLLFGAVCRRIACSPPTAEAMGNALGDLDPATRLLRPRNLAPLLGVR